MSIPTTPRIIVIVGPTASGKSELAVKLAKKFNGEVISADSRQVYRDLNIGTGKVPRDKTSKSYILNSKFYLHQGIPHHLLDVASPKKTFTVAKYQRLAKDAIQDILRRGKLPIICGGTGFYIQAVIGGLVLPHVRPNLRLRKQLEQRSTESLFRVLQQKDRARAQSIDRHNKRRLIRALEIIERLGKVPRTRKRSPETNVLLIGIKKSDKELKKLIEERLKNDLRRGLVAEVCRLHREGLSWKRLENFGLEYRHVARFLQKKISKSELIETLLRQIWRYARRQMTWFKKMRNVHWIKTGKEAEKIVKEVCL